MTETSPIPRSRRNLNDLDALIDASIGKGDAYGAISEQPAKPHEKSEPPSPTNNVSSALPEPSPEPVSEREKTPDGGRSVESQPERFRISIDASVILATKLTALQQKVSPSEIVERALRNFLNLPTRE